MQKKKILVIPSDTPHPSYIESIISPLSFLSDHYSIHPIDSLTLMDEDSNDAFYHHWEQELTKHIPHYDVFFGFSFGGVILQQCFSLFAQVNKPIVLFSTPSFADATLNKKLSEVISLCKENKVDDALHLLYKHVYYPNSIPPKSHSSLNNEAAAKRVIFGLSRVLETNSISLLQENQVNHLHLIGELSQLVNKDNVVAAQNGTLLTVPGAGMRMLRDNLPFCKQAILEALKSED